MSVVVNRISMLVVGSLATMACGPAAKPAAKIDGKQGAAEAMFAASERAKPAADWPLDVDASCPQGGTAPITSSGTATDFRIKYKDCGVAENDLGVAIYRGELAFTQSIYSVSSVFDQPNVTWLSHVYKGKIFVEGAYDDFLDVDLQIPEPLGRLPVKPGTRLEVIMSGQLTTSEGTFFFSESVGVVSGQIRSRNNENR